MYHIHIATTHHNEFLNITHLVSNMVREKGYKDGVVTVFVPHTTAGITINENADPDVTTDMMGVLNSLYHGILPNIDILKAIPRLM